MEGKRWRVMWGERMSGGRGEARSVGKWGWSVRRAAGAVVLVVRSLIHEGGGLGVDVLFPSLRVRSSGGGVSGHCGGERLGGLELVNQISGKTSRLAWTWARERHGEMRGWWGRGRAGGGIVRTW